MLTGLTSEPDTNTHTLTCGYMLGKSVPHVKTAGQGMIASVRGGIDSHTLTGSSAYPRRC